MELTPASIRYALDRLKDFESVHRGENLDSKVDALDIMMDSLGIDDKIKIMLIDWINRFEDGEGHEGSFMLGVIIGTFACRYLTEES